MLAMNVRETAKPGVRYLLRRGHDDVRRIRSSRLENLRRTPQPQHVRTRPQRVGGVGDVGRENAAPVEYKDRSRPVRAGLVFDRLLLSVLPQAHFHSS
jgi:hypothetical protein